MKNDGIKIISGFLLMIGSLFSFYQLKDINFLGAIAALLVMFVIGFGFVVMTEYFARLQRFLGAVKIEFYNIVWPKGHETAKSFAVVVVFSIIFSGIIWIIDKQLTFAYTTTFL